MENIVLLIGVITTLITSIFNIVLTSKANKNIKEVEKLKNKIQMDFLRFQKIDSLRLELKNCLNFSPKDVLNLKNLEGGYVIEKLINDGIKMAELFEKNKIFFDSELRKSLNHHYSNYSELKEEIQSGIMKTNKLEEVDASKYHKKISDLYRLTIKFKEQFHKTIDNQMDILNITD